MSEIILSTQNLTKTYAGRNVVDSVSINVKRGEVYGFVGLNGAGKTTLMRMVSGLIAPNAGDYSLFGKSGSDLLSVRSRVAAIIEGAVYYPTMTGRQNLVAYLTMLGKDTKKTDHFLESVGLDPALKTKAKAYSLGMRQRLSLAMALASDAELLLLDEPTNGLDPEGMYEIRQLLKTLSQTKGVTIFISSHILAELSKLATTYGFIHQGRLISEISAADIDVSAQKTHIVETLELGKASEIFGAQARVLGGKLEVEGSISTAEIIRKMDAAGLTVGGVTTRQGNLEDYFRQLIMGYTAAQNSDKTR